jgi:hypothetical protein
MLLWLVSFLRLSPPLLRLCSWHIWIDGGTRGETEYKRIKFIWVHRQNWKKTQTETCYYWGSCLSDPFIWRVSMLFCVLLNSLITLVPVHSFIQQSVIDVFLVDVRWTNTVQTLRQNEHMISVCSFFVCVTHTHAHTRTHTVQHNSTSLFWTNSLSGGKYFLDLSITSYKMGWDVVQTWSQKKVKIKIRRRHVQNSGIGCTVPTLALSPSPVPELSASTELLLLLCNWYSETVSNSFSSCSPDYSDDGGTKNEQTEIDVNNP